MSGKNNGFVLSIVVPTVNSGSIISQTLQTLADEISTFSFATEIVVVNDSSTDDTAACLLSFAGRNPELSMKIIEHAENFGQCVATINGLKAAAGKYLVVFDDDLQYPVGEIKRLLQALQEQKSIQLICGHRAENKSRRPFNRLLRWMAGACLQLFFPAYRDKHYFTSLKIMKRELLFKGSVFNGRNIYYFWTIRPDAIAFIPVSHAHSIRKASNYSAGKLLKGLDFLMVKFFQRMVLSVFLLSAVGQLIRYGISGAACTPKAQVFFLLLAMFYLVTFGWLKMKNKKMVTIKYKVLHEHS